MRRLTVLVVLVGLVGLPAQSSATNGMNLEGYGPVACSMGGVSLALPNGTAAMMNNPATLGLMRSGSSRLDIALGFLGPNVDATALTPQGALRSHSLADAFYMPAGGWVQKRSRFTFGTGVFAQGGMGTEYGVSSWMADPSRGVNAALQEGLVNRSEVSVGRVLLPVVYDVTERFHVGGSFDIVWAGIDLQMGMSEAQFVDMATTQMAGQVSGTMAQSFGMMYEPFGGMGIRTLHHAYFDFSNNNAFTGAARGMGYGAKVGAVYELSPKLTVGAVYHTQTKLEDLEANEATVTMGVHMDVGIAMSGVPNGQYADMNMPVSGSVTVNGFEWPSSFGAGIAYQVNHKLMVAADIRRTNWSGVMEDFKMTFVADDVPENGGFAGQTLDATLLQGWQDQTVLSIGGAYQMTDAIAFRAGYNYSDNPVPQTYLNALFPAIVESHVSVGMGYKLSNRSTVDFALSRGFKKKSTNPGNGSTVPAVQSEHGQTNGQIMYSFEF